MTVSFVGQTSSVALIAKRFFECNVMDEVMADSLYKYYVGRKVRRNGTDQTITLFEALYSIAMLRPDAKDDIYIAFRKTAGRYKFLTRTVETWSGFNFASRRDIADRVLERLEMEQNETRHNTGSKAHAIYMLQLSEAAKCGWDGGYENIMVSNDIADSVCYEFRKALNNNQLTRLHGMTLLAVYFYNFNDFYVTLYGKDLTWWRQLVCRNKKITRGLSHKDFMEIYYNFIIRHGMV